MEAQMRRSMTGPDQLEWQRVFVGAFTWDDFGRLLKGLDDRIDRFIGRDNVIDSIILRAIEDYVRHGLQNRLLMAALAARSDNQEIVELARNFHATSVPERHELESIIRQSNSMLNMGVWLENAVKIQQAVCRIEIPLQTDGTAFGTGFLVGPDLVITNYHVIEPVVASEDDPRYSGPKAAANSVTCRFDYREMIDGSRSAGIVYRLAAQWRVLLSPNNQNRQEPTVNELDCAVLRLARPAGTLAVGDKPDGQGTQRGWIKLPDSGPPALTRDTPLFIVQHPQAEPIKLALDSSSVLEVNASRTRVRYRTNTEHGSSGSPCFDQDWNLVALHHSGDPNFAFVYNEGIPIDTIVSSMQSNGVPVLYEGKVGHS